MGDGGISRAKAALEDDLRGWIRVSSAQPSVEVPGANRPGKVIQIARALYLAIETEERVGYHAASAVTDVGAENVGEPNHFTAGFQGLEQQQVDVLWDSKVALQTHAQTMRQTVAGQVRERLVAVVPVLAAGAGLAPVAAGLVACFCWPELEGRLLFRPSRKALISVTLESAGPLVLTRQS